MKKIFIIIFALTFSMMAVAQTSKKADRLYNLWEYNKAAALYLQEAENNPDKEVFFKLGECYRKMNRYADALSWYDKANAKGANSNPSFYLNYGLVLKNNEKYDLAKEAFKKYIKMVSSDPRGKVLLSSCDLVIEDHKLDQPIFITNVKSLNSPDAELCPVLFKDGIVFTSSRSSDHSKINEWNGSFFLDVFYAKKGKENIDFSDITPFDEANANQDFNDGPVCFSKNFDAVYITRVKKDLKGIAKKSLGIERNKIYSSYFVEGKWTSFEPFYLNSDTFSISTPYISPDGNKIFFSSDMPGGFGESDIYYCTRQGGAWSEPQNIGASVNTFGKEKFPYLDTDGNLYFSSDGYTGFGGLDICVALNKNGVFQKAIPMKYPFNSAADDIGITFIKSGISGYFSSNRIGGQGDYDVYYFDLSKDSVEKRLVTSIYTMGYRPLPKEIVQLPVKKIDTVKPMPKIDTLLARPKKIVDTVKIANTSEIESRPGKPIVMYIHFDYNKFNVRPDAITITNSIVKFMIDNPDLYVEIGGHTDSRGSKKYNDMLSMKRVQGTIDYLVSKGIDRKRMSAKSFGFSKLLNRCAPGVVCTDAEHEINRRVEFRFVIPKK